MTIRAVHRAASAILLPTLALVCARGAAARKACTEAAAERHPGTLGATLNCETATNCTGTGSYEPRMDVKLHGVILQPDSRPVSAPKFTTLGGEHGDLGGVVVGFGAALTSMTLSCRSIAQSPTLPPIEGLGGSGRRVKPPGAGRKRGGSSESAPAVRQSSGADPTLCLRPPRVSAALSSGAIARRAAEGYSESGGETAQPYCESHRGSTPEVGVHDISFRRSGCVSDPRRSCTDEI